MKPLEVREISIKYGGQTVVTGFTLDVKEGEAVALMGPSGSGKTSILHCIVGLSTPDQGEVWVAGEAMVGKASHRARLRREKIGVTYQTPALLPELSVAENVAITLLFDGTPREDALSKAVRALEAVGLGMLAGRRVDEVSGGEAQRIALARAIVREGCALLVADEPTASLDADTSVAISELMVSQVHERRLAAVIATHDHIVANACDRVVRLRSEAAPQ